MIFFFRTIGSLQPQRRGANFLRAASRRLWMVAGPCATAAFFAFLTGCAPSPPVAISPPKPPQSTPAQKAARSSTAAAAGESALERWWNALTKSAQSPASGSTPKANNATEIPVVAVDITAIASRHPAWKLADAMEKSRPTALRFEPLSGSAANRVEVASPSFDVDFDAPSNARASNSGGENAISSVATPEEFFPDSPSVGAQSVMANGLEALEARAEEDQRESITEFLRLVGQRQSDWKSDYNTILQIALNEDVSALQRTSLPAISPLLPSAEKQLEMTNLRLQLSRNIFATEQEVEAARARLDQLLDEWRETLRGQQQQRLQELQRLRVEEPQSAKSEGLQRIAHDLEAIENAQRVARIAISEEHRARVEQDFGDDTARLGIVLPASGVLPNGEFASATEAPRAQSTPAGSAMAALGLEQPIVFIRTNSVRASSVPAITAIPFSQANPNLDSKSARIQALRTLARQEAVKQIQMATRRAGWQWRTTARAKESEKSSGRIIPNRTREILQMLSN